jgi:hypothetical protein
VGAAYVRPRRRLAATREPAAGHGLPPVERSSNTVVPGVIEN